MLKLLLRIALLSVVSIFILSACGGQNAATTQPTPPTSAPTLPPSPTPVPPTPTPSPTPLPARYWVFPPYGSGGSQAWQIDNGQASPIVLPDLGFNQYDHSAEFGKVLHSSRFPEHGAGPANLSVGDLWSYDVVTKQDQQIFTDENIVEATFVPGSQDIVYLLATPTTYELHWRTAGGADRLLATDVSPTFSVSPDGGSVAFTRETGYKVGTPGVYIVSQDGTGERKIGSTDRGGTGSISDMPIWSPDGKYILLPVSSADVPTHWVLLKTDGSAEMKVTLGPNVPPQFKELDLAFTLWLPDSQKVLVSQVRGMAGTPGAEQTGVASLNLDTGEVTEITPLAFGPLTPWQWETPGKVAWAVDENNDLVKLDLDHPRPLPSTCLVSGEQVFVNSSKGYCFAYPQDVTIQAYEYERPLFLGPPLDQSTEPLQSRLWVEANAVPAGTDLNKAVDDFVAGLPTGITPPPRQETTLGGEPAVILEMVPGQLFSRVVLALHDGRLYQLWFNPVDPSVPDVKPDVEKLYQAVTSSFSYIP
jgi:hypothetical protein